ncbi:glycoside hydrolase family 3 C-terminal domain-containing protein [Asticcacaulis sp. 201]|uniref:glycoside hydrolase family 3 C-terminal domain-containing protein n=1 Tax=Asticcacaulis sp. 201 TaxID=3028787 RepID=UPI002916C547|nr:glycoside hydrolase family 3 C-terminal domain-containing protein [Asticcacaulis sp. 201]MDV6333171.1 glycoside hydrolase family 3 C-terminal domain-containing protein [Asticcacaulis sp. 201]
MTRSLTPAGRLLASVAPLALVIGLSVLPLCSQAALALSPAEAYLNKSLTPEARARDLVSRMTLEEKAAQMQDNAPAIPRLGLKRYGWWNEVLHGVARAGHATVYPQAIGLAATWDAPLMQDIGDAIAIEGRANHNAALARDPSGTDRYFGVNYWSPNINIFRDPRWGRGQETYGEDPYLTGHMAVAFIRGIQGNDTLYYKGIATPKHFVVHSGPEPLRHGFNVDVSPFDLEDTYTPAFRAAIVDAKADSLMCAYNAIDGFPACESPLLQHRLRGDWGFKGFIVTDCDSIDDMVTGHKKYPDAATASAAAVKAGSDLDCGSTYKALPEAVKRGLISEAELDVSLERLMAARIRMGLIDGGKYDAIPASEINSTAHRALALRTAEEAIVLLSNPKDLLPLTGRERIAVIGPNAQLLQSVEGNYTGAPVNPSLPLDAMRTAFGAQNVSYAPGASLVDGMRMPVPETFLHPAAGSAVAGLKGKYFDNKTFTGTAKLTRVDPVINFDFYRTAPDGFEPMNFSVRWTGVLVPPVAGTYKLGFRMQPPRQGQPMPEVKVWVDGKLVITPELAQAAGKDQAYCGGGACAQPPMAPVAITFTDTRPHDIRIDYVRAAEDRAISLDWVAPVQPLIDGAVAAAKASDIVVAFVGLSPDLEGEEMAVNYPGFSGGDRTSLALPDTQQQMLKAVKATGKKLVVVYLTGGAISDPWVEQNADAVVQAWYPGEAGGEAIARVLTGKVSPAGRLPYTVYRDVADLPPFEDYSMKRRTYRYFDGPVLYPFGHGLSYTRFAYADVKLSAPAISAGDAVTASVTVRNAGKRDSDEVVQLYVAKPGDAAKPVLAGFSRVHLKAGESRVVSFTLDSRALSQVDAQGMRKVVPGAYIVNLGGGQPGHAETVSTGLTVNGEATLPK